MSTNSGAIESSSDAVVSFELPSNSDVALTSEVKVAIGDDFLESNTGTLTMEPSSVRGGSGTDAHGSVNDARVSGDEREIVMENAEKVSDEKEEEEEVNHEEKEGEYKVSDLVWGKVKNYPWWPGQIFDPSSSTDKARKYSNKKGFLIAYFGDQSFAWNEKSKIKPFRKNFFKMEKQSTSIKFHHAVDCALDEALRRIEFGLSCSCLSKEVYDKIKSQTFVNAGIRKEDSRIDGGDNFSTVATFKPANIVQSVQDLAREQFEGFNKLQVLSLNTQLVAYYRWKGYHQFSTRYFLDGLDEKLEDSSEIPLISKPDSSDEKVSSKKRKFKDEKMVKDAKPASSDEKVSSKKRKSKDKKMVKDAKPASSDEKVSSKKKKFKDKKMIKDAKPASSDEKVLSEKRKFKDKKMIKDAKPASSDEKVLSEKRKFKDKKMVKDAIPASSEEKVSSKKRKYKDKKTVKDAKPASSDEQASSEKRKLKDKKMVKDAEPASVSEKVPRKRKLNDCDSVNSQKHKHVHNGDMISKKKERLLTKDGGKSPNGNAYRKSSIPTPKRLFGVGDSICKIAKQLSASPLIPKKESQFQSQKSKDSDSIDEKRADQTTGPMESQFQSQKSKDFNSINEKRAEQTEGSTKSDESTKSETEGSTKSDESTKSETKSVTSDSSLKTSQEKLAALILKFANLDSIPSVTDLNEMFRQYGTLMESETEVLKKSNCAKVVFEEKLDAETAFSSAGKFSIFGPSLISYKLDYSPTPRKIYTRKGKKKNGKAVEATPVDD